MQWNTGKNAGFSIAKTTWLPVPPTYKQVNVASEENNSDSLLNFYKAMLHLRREDAALHEGAFRSLKVAGQNVLAFERSLPDGKAVIVALNYQNAPQRVSLRDAGREGRILLSTFAHPGEVASLSDVTLPPFGVLIADVQ